MGTSNHFHPSPSTPFSEFHIFLHNSNNTYTLTARDSKTQEVVCEVVIGPKDKLAQHKPRFFALKNRALKTTYAFKFALESDAESFESTVNSAIEATGNSSQEESSSPNTPKR